MVREDEVLVAAGGGVASEDAVDSAGTLGVDCGNDREEVLVFVVVGFGGGDCFVEGVEDGWVVRAEGEFGDHVREVESCASQSDVKERTSDMGRRTAVIQMRCKFLIPMPPGRDMEITLHLIPLETPINPTRIRLLTPPHPRTLRKLLPRIPPHLPKHMVHMRILLLRLQPVIILLTQRLINTRPAIPLIHPQLPACIFPLQQLASENAVARRVLDVHAQRVAGHFDDHVEVELEFVRNALFDAKVVVFSAFEPGAQFGEGEDGADGED